MAQLTQGENKKTERSREAQRLLKVAVGTTAMCVGGALTMLAAGWSRAHIGATHEPLGFGFMAAAFGVGGLLSRRAVSSVFAPHESDAKNRAEQLSASPHLRQETLAALAKPVASRSTKFWPLLLFSLAIFVVSGALSRSLTGVVVLSAALAFHEAGHLSAMQAFGYRDTRVLFVPFIGALTMGTPENISVRRQAIVLLAGPLPGLLLGIGLLWSPFSGDPLVRHAANLLLALNAFNLLPLGSLDGGKLLSLLFSRSPVLEATFIMTSSVLLALMALGLQEWLLAVIAIVSVSAAPGAYRISRSARALGVRLAFPRSITSASEAFLRELFDEAYLNVLPAVAFRPVFKNRLPSACADAMRRVHAHWLQRSGL